MKKLLAVLALALIAAPAYAQIAGTPHDLSTANAGTSDEICVYCHTPHGADTTVALAPLWNRGTSDATAVYGGLDIQAVFDLASVNATDAPLCLSCHDGNVGAALVNPPNGGTTDLTGYSWNSSDANLGTDLSNDHPIGFNYALLNALDAEIDTQANAEAEGAVFFNTNEMWCSSCHDVHDNTNTLFLRTSNSGSALCLACHIK